MIQIISKLPLLVVAAGLLFICCQIANTKAEEDIAAAANALVPETLAQEVQGHENTSARKARQFGFPPPPPPPPYYGPFGPPPPPGYYGGGFGGGFGGRQRVITRTRYVTRYRGGGGFRGGFRG